MNSFLKKLTAFSQRARRATEDVQKAERAALKKQRKEQQKRSRFSSHPGDGGSDGGGGTKEGSRPGTVEENAMVGVAEANAAAVAALRADFESWLKEEDVILPPIDVDGDNDHGIQREATIGGPNTASRGGTSRGGTSKGGIQADPLLTHFKVMHDLRETQKRLLGNTLLDLLAAEKKRGIIAKAMGNNPAAAAAAASNPIELNGVSLLSAVSTDVSMLGLSSSMDFGEGFTSFNNQVSSSALVPWPSTKDGVSIGRARQGPSTEDGGRARQGRARGQQGHGEADDEYDEVEEEAAAAFDEYAAKLYRYSTRVRTRIPERAHCPPGKNDLNVFSSLVLPFLPSLSSFLPSSLPPSLRPSILLCVVLYLYLSRKIV